MTGGLELGRVEPFGLLGELTLLIIVYIDSRAVLRATVVALTHPLGRVMGFPECLEQRPIRNGTGIEHHTHDLIVSRLAAAHFLVCRIGRVTSRVTHRGRMHAFEVPEHLFGAPETTQTKQRKMQLVREGSPESIAVHKVCGGHGHRVLAARQCILRIQHPVTISTLGPAANADELAHPEVLGYPAIVMPSPLTSVGFTVHTQEQLKALTDRVMPEAMAVEADGGRYLHWQAPSGAELWLQTDLEGTVLGMTPHFRGDTRMKVGLVGRIERPNASQLDGALFAWAAPPGDDPGEGIYPFVFDVPNYRTHAELEIPSIQSVQLAAFAEELQVYASEQAFLDFQQDAQPPLASKSFLPIGLFTPDGAEVDPPQSRAILTGVIQETRQLTNTLTKAPFHWVNVETLGGNVDVLIDPEFIVDEPLKAGGILSGTFFLSGRIEK